MSLGRNIPHCPVSHAQKLHLQHIKTHGDEYALKSTTKGILDVFESSICIFKKKDKVSQVCSSVCLCSIQFQI